LEVAGGVDGSIVRPTVLVFFYRYRQRLPPPRYLGDRLVDFRSQNFPAIMGVEISPEIFRPQSEGNEQKGQAGSQNDEQQPRGKNLFLCHRRFVQ
jgi:hypothetical protein